MRKALGNTIIIGSKLVPTEPGLLLMQLFASHLRGLLHLQCYAKLVHVNLWYTPSTFASCFKMLHFPSRLSICQYKFNLLSTTLLDAGSFTPNVPLIISFWISSCWVTPPLNISICTSLTSNPK